MHKDRLAFAPSLPIFLLTYSTRAFGWRVNLEEAVPRALNRLRQNSFVWSGRDERAQGLKPNSFIGGLSARLKSCPDAFLPFLPNFSADCKSPDLIVALYGTLRYAQGQALEVVPFQGGSKLTDRAPSCPQLTVCEN